MKQFIIIILIFSISSNIIAQLSDGSIESREIFIKEKTRLVQVFQEVKYKSKLKYKNGEQVWLTAKSPTQFFDIDGNELFYESMNPGIFKDKSGGIFSATPDEFDIAKQNTINESNASNINQASITNCKTNQISNNNISNQEIKTQRSQNVVLDTLKNSTEVLKGKSGSLVPIQNVSGKNVITSNNTSNINLQFSEVVISNRKNGKVGANLQDRDNPKVHYAFINSITNPQLTLFEVIQELNGGTISLTQTQLNADCIAQKVSDFISQCQTTPNFISCVDKNAKRKFITTMIRECDPTLNNVSVTIKD